MPKKATKNTNVKPAKKSKTKVKSIPEKVLIALGKPFFLLIEKVFILVFFLTNTLFRYLGEVNIHRLSLPKFKIRNKVKTTKKQATRNPLSTSIKLKILRLDLWELWFIQKINKFSSRFAEVIGNTFKNTKIAVAIVASLVFVSYLYFGILKDLPSPKKLTDRTQEVSTKIYDRNGILLYKIYKDQNRTVVPLTSIPTHVRMATLAAEDAEFYNHPGFSIKGILRAIGQNIQNKSLQGGSTITQQLVKNVLLTPERTISRKIKELILSIEVETNYTKDKILEMYLNEVSYGGTAYGIESASEYYFGKNVDELSIAEAAFLAGLPKSPTTYSPYGPNPEASVNRQKEVLHLMKVNKFISEDAETTALNEELILNPNKGAIKAPHFVMYIRQMLVDKYGEEVVEKGGLEVITSLDMNIQEMAEKIVADEVDKLKNLNVGNGAALVMNPQTGEVLAMVGSKNYFDTQGDGQVNVILRLRQPGSSIKLINYAYALSHNYNAASMIDDSPITYTIPGSPPYSPVNYDGQFVGHVSLRSAFAQSRNIPAVKILASYGVDKMLELGEKMGITTWDEPGYYGLSLTLGGGATKAIDLAKAYATIANSGMRPEIMPILSIHDYKGKTLEENLPKSEAILDPRVAFLLTDILKDNNARAPEFGYNSYLVVKNHPEVAVKTGTSNDLRDNWAVGYNQNFLVLTWVGNNDNKPMSRIASGVTGASPIWNKIITALLADAESIDWKAPDGVSKINICQITGSLPCNGCPTRQEWFLDENRPKRSCVINPTATPVVPINKILEDGAKTQATPPGIRRRR